MIIHIIDESKKKTFTKLFKHLTSFTENVNIRCKSDRFYIQGMDDSHVSLFELILESTWFDKFEVKKEIVVGINIKIFSKLLSFREDSQSIFLNIDHGGDKLFIGLNHPSGTKGINKAFQIPLMDIEMDLLSVPVVEYTADFIVETKKIRNFVEELVHFGNTINIKCSEEEINFSSKGDEGYMEVKIDFDDLDEFQIDEKASLDLCYITKYLSWMLEYHDIIEMVHLFISKKYPMLIYYSLGGNSFLRFYVAPMIDDF